MIGKMLMIHKKNMNVILVVVACAAITAVAGCMYAPDGGAKAPVHSEPFAHERRAALATDAWGGMRVDWTALADGIPAESYATGANRIEHGSAWENRNVNMPNTARSSWLALYGADMNGNPAESWKHSDIKNRPYQVVREVFLSIVEKGNLR